MQLLASHFGATAQRFEDCPLDRENYGNKVPIIHNGPSTNLISYLSASIQDTNLETSSFFLNATRLTLGSLDKERKNADGTVNVYFGPKPPAGRESNWLYTQPGQKWFPWFRVYGPEKAIFDKSWKLPDIEKVK